MSFTATPKQISFIRSLAEERKSRFPEGVDAFISALTTYRLTGEGASNVIREMLAIDKDRVMQAEGSNVDPSRRPNRYAGKCHLCGGNVEAGKGYLAGRPGAWASEHVAGECVTAEEAAKPATHKMTEIVGDFADGYYAVPSTSGTTDLVFFRVGTNQGRINPSKKGQRYVRIVAGGGNDFGVSYEWVKGAIAMVNAVGPIESMRLFAEHQGCCGRCGEDLTQVVSRVTGFGPSCRAKLGIVPTAAQQVEIDRLLAEAKNLAETS